MTNVNTNIDDRLFYFYGVKPLEKEFANFDKKVCDYLVNTQGFSRQEAFIAWQLYKMNVKLTHIANFPIIVTNGEPQYIPTMMTGTPTENNT
jgi:hypothetical protein